MKHFIFDFDGTLTINSLNAWKYFWKKSGEKLGQNSRYQQLFDSFLKRKITHKSWVKLSANVFVKSGINKDDLNYVSKNQNLVNGFGEVVKYLIDNGFKLHIVSGGFKQVIVSAVGEYIQNFTSINANELEFDKSGVLKNILNTKYDFENKKLYVDELISKGERIEDIYFIGNDINDEWVARSGCFTICINPENTNCKNKNIWNMTISNIIDIINII